MTARRRFLLMGTLGSALGLTMDLPMLRTALLGASAQVRQLSQRLQAYLGAEEVQRLTRQFHLRYCSLREGRHLTEEAVLQLMQQEDAAKGAWVEVDGVRLSDTQLGVILSA